MTITRWRNDARGRQVVRPVAAQAEPLIHDIGWKREGGVGVIDLATRLERGRAGVEGEDRAAVNVELANLKLDRYLWTGTLKYPELSLLS